MYRCIYICVCVCVCVCMYIWQTSQPQKDLKQ